MRRRFFVALFALMVVATATPAAADLEACIPVLEAAEAQSNVIRSSHKVYDIAEAKARAILDKAKGDAAIALNKIKRDTQAAGQEWYYSEAEAEAQAIYNNAIRQADSVYYRALAAPQEALDKGKGEASAVLLDALREAWRGPTSDNPKIMAAILVQFLRDCVALLAADLDILRWIDTTRN